MGRFAVSSLPIVLFVVGFSMTAPHVNIQIEEKAEGIESGLSNCVQNRECGQLEYCMKEAGNCDGEGTCEVKPSFCMDIWDPVCGCDGETYTNSCFAARAGVNVDYEGE